jgi:hypothetical protein
MLDRPFIDGEPNFSDEEMTAMFARLGVKGDIANEADRNLAIDALNSALIEAKDALEVEALLANIWERRAVAGDLASQGSITPIRLASAESSDCLLPDDDPSTGRLLNAVDHAKRGDNQKRSGARERVGAVGGEIYFKGTTFPSLDLEHLLPGRNSDGIEKFLVLANENLLFENASWKQRFSQWLTLQYWRNWMKTDIGESRWKALKDRVEVHLRHGENQWDIAVTFEDYVILAVVKGQETVVRQAMAPERPKEFSDTLLHALDGDVLSARMALTAVRTAFTSEKRQYRET